MHLEKSFRPFSILLLKDRLEVRKINLNHKFDIYLTLVILGPQLMLALEELHWLLLVTGYFLCDSPEGETIMAPALLMGHFEIPEGTPDPVVVVVNQVLTVAKFENSLLMSRQHANYWSPLLAETVSWFLQRWVYSYLLLDESQFIRYPLW